MSGYFRTAILAVLMVFVFVGTMLSVPQTGEAKIANTGTNTCSIASCHPKADALAFDNPPTISVSVENVTQATAPAAYVSGTLAVNAGDVLEIDWSFTDLEAAGGASPNLWLPLGWAPSPGTTNTPAVAGWNTVWDAATGESWNLGPKVTDDAAAPDGWMIDHTTSVAGWGNVSGVAQNDGLTGDLDLSTLMGGDVRVTAAGSGLQYIWVNGSGKGFENGGKKSTKGSVGLMITLDVSVGGDVTPPVLVADFTATSAQNAQVPLSWTNPADVDLDEVLVMRKVGSYPTDHADAGATQVYQNVTPVVSGAETPTDTTGPPVNGTTYYYAVFTKDITGNWNDTVTGGSNANTATPDADVTPPALVADFTATTAQNAQVPLAWTNPADVDLAEVLVMRKVGSYPTDHADAGATQVYQNLAPVASGAESPTDTTGPPVNGTTYYYAVFTKDSTGNWNETVTGGSNANTATPSAGNANPDPPTNLSQNYLAITPIALGGYTTEASVVFEADIADSTDGGDTVKLQIDTDTSGTSDCESVLGPNPSANVQVTCGLADGSYDWQARTVDNIGAVSAWVPFDAASPDFIKDASAPADGTLTATPGDTQVVLTWTIATDPHSGLTSPAYAVAKLAGGTPPADCSTPLTTTDLLTYTDNAVANGSTYSYRICATNNAGLQSAGTTDSATPSAGCSYTDPTVTILTASKDITTDGGFTDYTVQVTNNDTAICANANYTLSVSDSNSTNFYTSVLAQTSLTNVAPGASAQTTFRVSALANQPNSVTDNSDVTTALDGNHAAVTSAAITTTINVSGGGCVANGNYLNTNGDQLISTRR